MAALTVEVSIVDDDLYELYAKGAADAAGRAAFAKGLELGIEIGREQGMAAGLITGLKQGRVEGMLATREALKAAIADGTRHGSSECARVLESMKRWDAAAEE